MCTFAIHTVYDNLGPMWVCFFYQDECVDMISGAQARQREEGRGGDVRGGGGRSGGNGCFKCGEEVRVLPARSVT